MLRQVEEGLSELAVFEEARLGVMMKLLDESLRIVLADVPEQLVVYSLKLSVACVVLDRFVKIVPCVDDRLEEAGCVTGFDVGIEGVRVFENIERLLPVAVDGLREPLPAAVEQESGTTTMEVDLGTVS